MIPKFRAFWKSEKKMITDISWMRFDKEDLIGRIDGQTILPIGFSKVILMRSTGLVDKNGVEVFEGDILHYPEQEDDQYGVVKFDKNRLAFVLDTGYELLIYGDDWEPGEVIGNIHEHLELLEGNHA